MISDIKCNVIYYLEWHISDAICAIKKSLDAISWQVRACGRSPPGQLHISHLAGQRVWQVFSTKLDFDLNLSDAMSDIGCNITNRMQCHISDAICAIKKISDTVSWQVSACGRSPPQNSIAISNIGCYVRYRMQYHKLTAMSYIGCNMRSKKNIGCNILAGQNVWQVPAGVGAQISSIWRVRCTRR